MCNVMFNNVPCHNSYRICHPYILQHNSHKIAADTMAVVDMPAVGIVVDMQTVAILHTWADCAPIRRLVADQTQDFAAVHTAVAAVEMQGAADGSNGCAVAAVEIEVAAEGSQGLAVAAVEMQGSAEGLKLSTVAVVECRKGPVVFGIELKGTAEGLKGPAVVAVGILAVVVTQAVVEIHAAVDMQTAV